MKKVYISQRMQGKSIDQLLTERELAVLKVKQMVGPDVEIVNALFKDVPIDVNPLWYLGRSLELLSTADYVYFVEGWQEHNTSKIEYLCATEYGIKELIDIPLPKLIKLYKGMSKEEFMEYIKTKAYNDKEIKRLKMRYVNNKTYKEIASYEGVEISTIEKFFQRFKKKV